MLTAERQEQVGPELEQRRTTVVNRLVGRQTEWLAIQAVNYYELCHDPALRDGRRLVILQNGEA